MLSAQEAHRIIKSVHFPGEENLVRNEKICQASKKTRRDLIIHHGKTEEQKIAAAVEIQRIWRGFWTRLRLASILQAAASSYQGSVIQKITHVSSDQSLQPLHEDAKGYEDIPYEKPLKSFSATSSRKKHLNVRYQRYLEKAAQHGTSEVISYEEFCAHFIQNWWSKVKGKHAIADHSSRLSAPSPVKSVSIIMSPSGIRASSKTRYKPKKKKREGPLESEEAARIIQTAWRRHIVSFQTFFFSLFPQQKLSGV
ncbi:hypothetical protein HOLleu_45084 [Holothuria leucospilota]|uniref:Uncharacterized protein n=1 Tax=Holothuria leucospilota TaxID=206669 RepID=A0A9Q1B8G6_HOLLE|nr:hypothetical protein HOLleu_45084 [Holothuria leucospilota]